MNNEVSNNSNNELNVKSNNNSKIIIVILAILLIGALGFICYDKFINKEKPPVPTPTPVPTDDVDNEPKGEYAEWMTYLLNLENSKLSVDDDIYHKDISIADLRVFFNEVNSHQYNIKELYGGTGDGLHVRIEYSKNGKDYMVRFQPLDNGISVIFDFPDNTDKELINLIDKIPHETEDPSQDGNIYHFICPDGEVKYSVFEVDFNQ